jgi:hypothetical protein
MRVEDEHLDVLQNIEFAIVTEFREDGSILDLNVLEAVNALVRHYEAGMEGRRPPEPRLSDLSRRIFVSVGAICEWRLGRDPGPAPEITDEPESEPKTTAEIVACLKRIHKSIGRWTRESGKRGYLEFAGRFIV